MKYRVIPIIKIQKGIEILDRSKQVNFETIKEADIFIKNKCFSYDETYDNSVIEAYIDI